MIRRCNNWPTAFGSDAEPPAPVHLYILRPRPGQRFDRVPQGLPGVLACEADIGPRRSDASVSEPGRDQVWACARPRHRSAD